MATAKRDVLTETSVLTLFDQSRKNRLIGVTLE